MAVKNFNAKFKEEDWEVLKLLADLYDMDNTALVRSALRYVLKHQPTFEIEPVRGKFIAPAVEAALSPMAKM